MGFKLDSLPFRYLGIPIFARRLHVNEYQGLVDGVTQRIRSWEAKLLSYTGRIELIKSVMLGFKLFGSSTFLFLMQSLI